MKKKEIKKSELARVRAPKGYSFKVVPPDYAGGYTYVRLFKKGVPYHIGQISLENYGANTFATHSRLEDAYHGKGLGAIMYAKAIQWCLDNGYKVRSSGSPSEYAQRVWGGSSLRRYFSIRQIQNGSYYKTWSVLKQKKKQAAKKPTKKFSKKAK